MKAFFEKIATILQQILAGVPIVEATQHFALAKHPTLCGGAVWSDGEFRYEVATMKLPLNQSTRVDIRGAP